MGSFYGGFERRSVWGVLFWAGARWGPGLVAAAVLFGLCHLIDGNLVRLHVIPFGLFAGWLRERTGTILVPAAYHGASNILYYCMQRSMA